MTMYKFRTISSNTFHHVGCAINLHSIIYSVLIPEDKIWAIGRQYSFCLWILWTKNKDLDTIDLSVPRLAQNKQKSMEEKNTVYWVDIKLAEKKMIKVLSDAIERHHSIQYTPAYCNPKVVRLENGEKMQKRMRYLGLFQIFPWNMTGFRSWSTTRRCSCSTSKNFPIKATTSKPRSW